MWSASGFETRSSWGLLVMKNGERKMAVFSEFGLEKLGKSVFFCLFPFVGLRPGYILNRLIRTTRLIWLPNTAFLNQHTLHHFSHPKGSDKDSTKRTSGGSHVAMAHKGKFKGDRDHRFGSYFCSHLFTDGFDNGPL